DCRRRDDMIRQLSASVSRIVGGAAAVALAGAGLLGLRRLCGSIRAPTSERTLDGLEAAVTVDSDRYGVPTIRAGSRCDAMRALGYLTARDRLFQMDLYRRMAAGRLSEVMGPAALEADIEQRVIGLGRIAPAVE